MDGNVIPIEELVKNDVFFGIYEDKKKLIFSKYLPEEDYKDRWIQSSEMKCFKDMETKISRFLNVDFFS